MSAKKDKSPARPRHDRFIREFQHPPYTRLKLPEPTVCHDCRAVYHKGRWQWTAPPDEAQPALCPACRRMHEKRPAGFLTLSGPFAQKHRREILDLARHIEARENMEHALRRIMSIEEQQEDVIITTTEMDLARAIGVAIHHAYQGVLNYRYTDATDMLRIDWKR